MTKEIGAIKSPGKPNFDAWCLDDSAGSVRGGFCNMSLLSGEILPVAVKCKLIGLPIC